MSNATDDTAGAGGVIEDPMDYIDFVAKYHGDAAFRKTVDADPAAALRSEGVEVKDGVDVKLVPSGENLFHIVLPPPRAHKDSGDR